VAKRERGSGSEGGVDSQARGQQQRSGQQGHLT